MSDIKYEFTGYVTNIEFFNNKFYITVETFEVFPPEQLERAKRVAKGEGYRLIIEYDDGSVKIIGHCV